MKKNKKDITSRRRWFMDIDYDSNNYLIPVDKVEEWTIWLAKANIYPAPKAPSWARLTKEGMGSVTFTEPRILKKTLAPEELPLES